MSRKRSDSAAFHWWYWIAGPIALAWILLRSGANPTRLSYPCQQAAMPVAATWVMATLAFLGGSILIRRYARVSVIGLGLAGAAWLAMTFSEASRSMVSSANSLPVWEVAGPISTVFVMDSVALSSGSLAAGDASVPDSHLPDPAMDTLLAMMARRGTFLHQTSAHPEGIVGANNIVIIKGNFQWTHQNTTSTDRIKGLIWQILNHPDGFTGEILVCDNTQDVGTGVNDQDDNSDFPGQSIVDVTNTFYAKGYPVFLYDWTPLWGAEVGEYDQGMYVDGYPYDPVTHINYPKFQTPAGTYVSLRYGIWDPIAETYDHDRLCIVDFPVLKQHFMAGATVAVKNWIGLMTTYDAMDRYGSWNDMHYVFFWGEDALVARTMEVTFPRLTVVDADWISTRNANDLSYLFHAQMLCASTDPVAASWYAARFMLSPVATLISYTDPDRPGSRYGATLDAWANYLAAVAGLPCTRDSAEISVYDRSILCACPHQSDFDEDGFLTAIDLGALIDILFAGAVDVQDPWCPSLRGDFDCDRFTTAIDLSGLIDYLFAGGSGPCDPCNP